MEWERHARLASWPATAPPDRKCWFGDRDDKRAVNITAQIESAEQRYFPIFPLAFSSQSGGKRRLRKDPRVAARGENGDVVEIANSAMVRRASAEDATGPRARAASPDGDALVLLTTLAVSQWRTLAERPVEPNASYLPDWELAVNAFASRPTRAPPPIAPNDS